MHQNNERFVLRCENCDHAYLCRTLNPYKCKELFTLATGTNFSVEELEQVDYYLSLSFVDV